jgi:hypothetical protein
MWATKKQLQTTLTYMRAIREKFDRKLEAIFRDAEDRELDSVEIRASDLHRSVGGYPGQNDRMPVCCQAMRRAMAPTDVVVASPPKGDGASLLIRYDIPRPDSASVDPTETVSSRSSVDFEVAFQRIGSTSNTQVGADFENAASAALAGLKINVEQDFSVPVGVGRLRKKHKFDLGGADPPILVECKSHRWTTGGNAPSAKLTVWNEAMYYFAIAPIGFRKILFVLRDFSEQRGLTLAEHYLSRFLHLVPEDVEIWEYDEDHETIRVLDIHGARQSAPA